MITCELGARVSHIISVVIWCYSVLRGVTRVLLARGGVNACSIGVNECMSEAWVCAQGQGLQVHATYCGRRQECACRLARARMEVRRAVNAGV